MLIKSAAKRRKLAEEENASSRREPPSRPAPLKTSEFLVADLEEFYKPFPSYRLPLEIGAFLHDEQGRVHMDRSQLATHIQLYTRRPSARARARPHLGSLRSRMPNIQRQQKHAPPGLGIRECLDSRSCARTASCFKPRAALKTPDMQERRGRRGATRRLRKRRGKRTPRPLPAVSLSAPMVIHFL